MRLSSQLEYAMVAMAHLARQSPGAVSSIGVLSDRLNIPRPFLEKTLLSLKRAGYVESKMGKHGGFRLACAPREIRLADIVRLFGQPIASSRSVSSFFHRETPLASDPGLTLFFKSMRDYNAMRMETTTVADIVSMESARDCIYLDHAATSFPKPAEVARRMDDFIRNEGGSGGRSGHTKSIAAYGIIAETREALARLFHATSADCVCLMSNATEALNTAIFGLAEPGCRIVTTAMEHNSVWRPLYALQTLHGCQVVVVRADAQGICDRDELARSITPETRFVVMTSASNVTGAIQPFQVAAEQCRKHGVALILDAAQAAGALPIDLRDLPNSVLAFTGHKGLLGPQGTGGFVVDPELATRIKPLKFGGTGERSGSPEQPSSLPEKFEAGTLNGHGIAGLGAGCESILSRGIDTLRAHEMKLWRQFREGLLRLEHVRVYGPKRANDSVAIVSLNIPGMQPTDVGFLLDARSGVMTRTGLHCAPLAHESIGTAPLGTVRFSFGSSNTESDVEATLATLATLHQ